jgi:hypothetical protein
VLVSVRPTTTGLPSLTLKKGTKDRLAVRHRRFLTVAMSNLLVWLRLFKKVSSGFCSKEYYSRIEKFDAAQIIFVALLRTAHHGDYNWWNL